MKLLEYAGWNGCSFLAMCSTILLGGIWTVARAAEPALKVESYYEGGDAFQCFAASEFAVGGLALGAAEAWVAQKLGKPNEIVVGEGEDDGGSYTVQTYQYSGLTVDVVRGEVDRAEMLSPDFATPSGLRLGMNRDEVAAILGREPSPDSLYEEWYTYPLCPGPQGLGPESYLEFKFGENGKLEGLRFFAERP